MNVILLEKIHRLGDLGDQVAVKAGYARNFLIPQGKAVLATEANIGVFEKRRAELEKAAAASLKAAQERADALQVLTIVLKARAADEGKLYGSIGTHELADAITAAGVIVHKSEIRLPNGPLRQLGEHEVDVALYGDIKVTIKLTIVPEA